MSIAAGQTIGGVLGWVIGTLLFVGVLLASKLYRRRGLVRRKVTTTKLKKGKRVIEERQTIEEEQEIEGS